MDAEKFDVSLTTSILNRTISLHFVISVKTYSRYSTMFFSQFSLGSVWGHSSCAHVLACLYLKVSEDTPGIFASQWSNFIEV